MSLAPAPPRRPRLWEAWTSTQLVLFALLLLAADFFWQAVIYQLTQDAFTPVLGAALLAVAVPCGLAAWWHGESLWRAFEMRAGLVPLGAGAAAGLLAWAPVSLLADLSARLSPPTPDYLEFLAESLPHGTTAIILAFTAVIVGAPLAEELIFRGLLFRLARRWWGPVGAAVLTALFFGIVHWQLWSLFGLVALGLLLAALYHLTGSLLAAMIAHAVHNAISLALLIQWDGDPMAETTAGAGEWLLLATSTALLLALLRWLRRRQRSSAVD